METKVLWCWEMEFKLTPEQEMLQDTAREFAEKEVEPRVEEIERTRKIPEDLIKRLFELGFGGIIIPEEFDGSGAGHLARAIVLEEIAYSCPALAFTLQIVHLGQGPLIFYGSKEQKEKWLPDLAKGKLIASCAVTEPTGGSDVMGIKTFAKKENNEYVITGRKCFITNVHLANIHGVLAKSGEDPRHMTFFMIEGNRPGVKPGREENKVGLRGCNTGELILDNVRVSVENVIGVEGKGLRVALTAITNVGRMGVAATALGIMRRCLDEAVKFANQRVLYGQPISKLQAIQWLVSDIYLRYESARLLLHRAAWMIDQGIRADAEVGMAKLTATEGAVECASKLSTILGGYGIMEEYAAQRLFRDAYVLVPAAGTNEIMKIIISRKAFERTT